VKLIFCPDLVSYCIQKPMAPTVHANWRYFEMYDDNGKCDSAMVGGGQDLTPYYLFEERFIFIKPVKPLVINISRFYPKYNNAMRILECTSMKHGPADLFSIIARNRTNVNGKLV
jgi:hypothetical protein